MLMKFVEKCQNCDSFFFLSKNEKEKRKVHTLSSDSTVGYVLSYFPSSITKLESIKENILSSILNFKLYLIASLLKVLQF